nr:cysteine-rich receptor-like protein kinase 15 [Ziziphus jujuba var. spinosa]
MCVRGYMPPKYTLEEILLVKSDVFSFEFLYFGRNFLVKYDIFSFRVLLFEIVSGRKNSSFYVLDGPLNLVECAWDLWQKSLGLDLVDQVLKNSCAELQVLRFIHVSLARVEDCPIDRPAISEVVSMLNKESWPLPPIKIFYQEEAD